MRLLLLLLLAGLSPLFAQQTNAIPPRPKLVIGIVVDQMRYDYLYRYKDSYSSGGFNRLLNEGFSCENTHYNYVPTYTGPGHAAIYSGTTPAVNGVIANEWWDRDWNEVRYVTRDKRYKSVGGPLSKSGQHSPAVMLSSNLSDELRLSNNYRSKVVGVCLKDRGSILPAGHIPNACYWFDDDSGNWITSTYYPDSLGLPQWVQDFNAQKLPEAFINKDWEKLPNHGYTQSFDGWKKYEHARYLDFPGDLPYDLNVLKQKTNNYNAIRFTPFANTLTLAFAKTVIDNMELGQDADPDLLCLSFSSPDYCAHQFGIHAEETEDTYLKLDLELANFLQYLDKKLGKDNFLLFLTADHGGSETPAHLCSLHIPSGVFASSEMEAKLEAAITQKTGIEGDFIAEVQNEQVWLKWEVINDLDLKASDIYSILKETLRAQAGVYDVFTRDELKSLPEQYPFATSLLLGIHPRRSGDLIIHLDPAWHGEDKYFKDGGATHGSPYAYDTHVPLLWYGWRVPQGESFTPVNITDIAPTLSAMLRIMEPNGTTGKVIEPLMRK